MAVAHLNDIGMDPDGIEQAERVCLWLLTSRLELMEDRNRYPMAAEVIDHPMFVTGEPRSGTTLMHALMAVDPNARALRFWEVMYPSPPPGIAGPDDPRRARADADWREINASSRCRVGFIQELSVVAGKRHGPTRKWPVVAVPPRGISAVSAVRRACWAGRPRRARSR